MTSQGERRRWQRVEEIFLQALELDREKWEEFLAQACETDDLRTEVARMLAADQQAERFLETPAADLPALSAVWSGDTASSRDKDTQLPVSGGDNRQIQNLIVGQILAGRFEILRFLAAGGMGEVYEARDLELEERVAIKTIRPELAADPAAMDRFRREVQLARRVTHPGVCRIFDIFRHPPGVQPESGESAVTFLSMELLEGETLAERLATQGPLSPPEATPILRQMVAALSAAHSQGIVHRDLKSANVFLVPSQEGGPRVVVTDFGLARLAGAVEESGRVTRSGLVLGTPAYMAPEQMAGEDPSAATDVYALGVLFYEVLTGRLPFGDAQALAIAVRRLKEPPSPPSRWVAGLEKSWDRMILGCLTPEPAQRFQSAKHALQALEGQAGQSGAWRLGFYAAAIGSAVVGLVLASWWFSSGHQKKEISEPRGSPELATAASTVEPADLVGTARKAIAVLGPQDLSGREESLWLSTALSEMLTMELAAGEQVRTISGENVARMKLELALPATGSWAPDTVQRVRQYLGCDLLVMGTFFAGDDGALRVDLRLEDARIGETKALLIEEGQVSELLRLVSAVGRKLRTEIGLDVLSPDENERLRSTVPQDPEAARLFAEGLAQLRLFDAAGARDSLALAADLAPESPRIFAALAEAWSTIGHDSEATAAALRAFDLAERLPRPARLQIEGQYRRLSSDWEQASEIYHTLRELFPDDLEHGLHLAEVQIASGRGDDALVGLTDLRAQLDPGGREPRIDLMEALAAESRSDYPRSLAAAQRAIDRGKLLGARWIIARAGFRQGRSLWRQGKLDAASSAAAGSEEVFRELGDDAGRADALNLLANLDENRGELDAAEAKYQMALSLHREIGHQDGVVRVLDNLGILTLGRGQVKKALAFHEEALKIGRELGNRPAVARSLNNLARISRREGDGTAAQALFEQVLSLAREIGDRTLESSSLNSLGIVLRHRGDFEGSLGYYQESLRLAEEIGNPRDIATRLNNLGLLFRQRGETEAARGQYLQALAIYRDSGDRRREGRTLNNLAALHRKRGELTEAKGLYREVAAIHQEISDSSGRASYLNGLGLFAALRNELATARRHLEAGIALRVELGQENRAWAARVDLARVDLAAGQLSNGIDRARQAGEVFARSDRGSDELAAWSVALEGLLQLEDHSDAGRLLRRGRELYDRVGDQETKLYFEWVEARWLAVQGDRSSGFERLVEIEQQAQTKGLRVAALEVSLALVELMAENDAANAEAKCLEVEKDAARLELRLLVRRCQEIRERLSPGGIGVVAFEKISAIVAC